MNWREKLGEANKLFEGAKAIMGNSEATAEQKEGVPQMLEDARKLMQEALQYKNLLEDAQKVIGLQQTLETFSDTKERDAVQEPEFKSWEEFLACCWQASKGQKRDPRLHWFKDVPEAGHEEKALSGAAGSTGGFLVPTQFLPQLQAVQGEDVIMRRAGATVIRMASRQVTLPVLDQTDTAEGYPH
ncbi:MAG: phage major capsid protein, partial [Acholeplasmataceae bacterium]